MMGVEHEYERRGALSYLAAWDVHRGRLFGRCEATTGIVPFGRLVDQVMSQAPVHGRAARVLDRRQRFQPSRQRVDQALAERVAESDLIRQSEL